MIHLILLQNRIQGIGDVLGSFWTNEGNRKIEFLFLHKFRTHRQLTADGNDSSYLPKFSSAVNCRRFLSSAVNCRQGIYVLFYQCFSVFLFVCEQQFSNIKVLDKWVLLLIYPTFSLFVVNVRLNYYYLKPNTLFFFLRRTQHIVYYIKRE